MRCVTISIIALFCLFAARPVCALDISPHRQLLIALTSSWNDFNATICRFEKKGAGWVQVGKRMPAVVGERGLGWDPTAPERDPGLPVKREGDRRAPAGLFRLSGAMGFSLLPPAETTLPFRTITPGLHCVDDGESPYYNRIVSEEELSRPVRELWQSSERMWQMPDPYRLLLVVDYNREAPKPGNGSCIFLHIWRGKGQPTSGCTALAEKDLTEIVKWLRPEADPALVQLPVEVYRQVWRKWRLPDPVFLDGTANTEKYPLVDVQTVAPETVVEMRYAQPDNFTGKTVYSCGRCFLHPETAAKVARATRELRKIGLSLKMWDCYRPLSVQKIFWSLVPDPRYVADPQKGSRHNRGTAVDVTLVDATGRELEMPTKFDDFSARASNDATGLPAQVAANRRLLVETMVNAGFRPLQSEWWHYDDADGSGKILDISFDDLCGP